MLLGAVSPLLLENGALLAPTAAAATINDAYLKAYARFDVPEGMHRTPLSRP